MKYIVYLLIFTPMLTFANPNIVNVYTWADYIPNNVIQQFEKQTGIHVNLSEYDNNETLYAKLRANPKIGYDVIFPSSYYVDRMRKQGMLHKLDKSKIQNQRYLNPSLLKKPFDPNNDYSLPYLWGTTGILVNKKYWNPKQFTTWQSLWDPKLKNQLLIYDDLREVFSMALITLHYSINDENPEHIKQAYLKLKTLMPNVKLFNEDSVISTYADDDATIGMAWNGDYYLAKQNNSNLKYIFPKGHFTIWIDCVSIAHYAPHLANANKFINFINQPEIAKEIFYSQGYSTPNLATIKLLPKKIQRDPVLNPSADTLKRGAYQKDISDQTLKIYSHYWELLKLST